MSAHDPRAGEGDCGGHAAPYVLGALTEAEHEAFAHHLASCAVCREEVGALQAVASSLPAAVPQLEAPPELKQRVMAVVHEDAERARASQTRRAPALATRRRWRPALVPASIALATTIALIAVLARRWLERRLARAPCSGERSWRQRLRAPERQPRAAHARQHAAVRPGSRVRGVDRARRSAVAHRHALHHFLPRQCDDRCSGKHRGRQGGARYLRAARRQLGPHDRACGHRKAHLDADELLRGARRAPPDSIGGTVGSEPQTVVRTLLNLIWFVLAGLWMPLPTCSPR